jgi:hypothetical protein
MPKSQDLRFCRRPLRSSDSAIPHPLAQLSAGRHGGLPCVDNHISLFCSALGRTGPLGNTTTHFPPMLAGTGLDGTAIRGETRGGKLSGSLGSRAGSVPNDIRPRHLNRKDENDEIRAMWSRQRRA